MRISDWSSDVCSSDLDLLHPGTGVLLGRLLAGASGRLHGRFDLLGGAVGVLADKLDRHGAGEDRKSVVSGKSVSVRVVLGGRRLIKKTTENILSSTKNIQIVLNKNE